MKFKNYIIWEIRIISLCVITNKSKNVRLYTDRKSNYSPLSGFLRFESIFSLWSHLAECWDCDGNPGWWDFKSYGFVIVLSSWLFLISSYIGPSYDVSTLEKSVDFFLFFRSFQKLFLPFLNFNIVLILNI